MATPDHYEVPRIPGVDASVQLLADAFHHYLLAAGRSEHTIKADTTAVRLFGAFLVAQGFPQELKAIRRTHAKQYSISIQATCKPATVADRRKDLHCFFPWASTGARSPRTRWPKWPSSPCPT